MLRAFVGQVEEQERTADRQDVVDQHFPADLDLGVAVNGVCHGKEEGKGKNGKQDHGLHAKRGVDIQYKIQKQDKKGCARIIYTGAKRDLLRVVLCVHKKLLENNVSYIVA